MSREMEMGIRMGMEMGMEMRMGMRMGMEMALKNNDGGQRMEAGPGAHGHSVSTRYNSAQCTMFSVSADPPSVI